MRKRHGYSSSLVEVVILEWMVLRFDCSWYWVGITMGMVCKGAYQHRFYVLVLSRRVLMWGNKYKDRSGRCYRISTVDRDGWSQAGSNSGPEAGRVKRMKQGGTAGALC